MRHWGRVLLVSLSIACVAVACSLENGGTILGEGADGSSGGDGTVGGDGSTDDGSSGGDGSSTGDSGDASADSGGDSGTPATFLCAASPVGQCQTDCPGFPNNCPALGICVNDCTTCVSDAGALDVRYCNACFDDGGPAIAVCVPSDPASVASCLAGYTRCPCPTSVSDCPGPYQTCESNECFACGEPDAGNDGHNCKGGTGGKNCDTGGSAADHLRCH